MIGARRRGLAFVWALTLACSARPVVATPRPGPVDARLPDGARPTHYTIELDVDPSLDRFRGTEEIQVDLEAPTRVVWIHARDLHVTGCSVETADAPRGAAAFEQVSPGGLAKVTLSRETGPGRAVLRFAWDAAFGDAAQEGLHRWRSGGEVYVLPQFGGLGASAAFPAFADVRFKTPFDVSLTVPAALAAIGNEPAVEETALPGGVKRVRFATTRPLPTYPLFVGVGPFEMVARPVPPNEVRGWSLPARGIAPRGRARELAFALDVAGPLLADLERWFALAYPYGKLDHVAAGDFSGAYEDAGAILYGADQLLLDPDHPDDERRRTIAWAMAHEMAHQWFGNLVTTPTDDDVWLSETFAEFVSRRVIDAHWPGWQLAADHAQRVERIMNADGLASAHAVRTRRIDDFTFAKGTAVLETLERFVGRERFRGALREYVRAHVDGSGSVEDVVTALSRAAGRDVAPALLAFVDRPGIPLVLVRVECGHGGARAHLSQRRWHARGARVPEQAWNVPVCARFEIDGATREQCALVPPEGTDLELPSCPAWLLPDSGGVGYYRWALARPDRTKLLARGMRHLSALERLSVARNLRAAQRSGDIRYDEAMDAIARLASDESAAVAAVVMDSVRHARDDLLDPDDRPLAEAVARRLFRPMLGGDGFDAPAGEDDAARRRRIEVVRFLAQVGRDSAVRREAERRGVAYAGLDDGRFHPEVVPADLAVTALRVALEERGAALYDALLPRLQRAEGDERSRLLSALALASSPALGGRPGALWRDPRLRPDERLAPALLEYDVGVMRRTYAQMSEHLEEMVAAVPAAEASRLPLAARELCDAARVAEARALLAHAVERHPAMREFATRALEQGEVCAAEREAEKAAAKRWFARAAAR